MGDLVYLAFFGLGIAVSFINSIAGGASSLSLPLMILLGLPPTVANGTNRVGLFVGSVSAVLNLRKNGHLRWNLAKKLLPAVVLGSIAGTFLAVSMDDEHFQWLLAGVMILVVILSSLGTDPLGKPPVEPPKKLTFKSFLGFLGVGFYGGFLQVGMGFIQIFALRKWSGLSMVEVNAIKNTLTMAFIACSMVIFAGAGKVMWGYAACMAVGSALGGWLGGQIQHKRGQKFIQKFVQLAAVALAGKLVWDLV